jgi:xanthine dehydrogenase molybdenum-binding subunit
MAKKMKVIGNKDITVRKEEARQKVTGEAKFTIDFELPHMLHMKVLRSPHAHATIIRYDDSVARALPGVKGIVSYKEMIGKTQGSGPTPGVRHDVKMRFYGEAVAAVAAETEEIAEAALELINIRYKVHGHILDQNDALKRGAEKIYPGGNVSTAIFPSTRGPTFQFHKGDVKKGFSEADIIVEKTVRTHGQYQAPLEGHSCLADWDPSSEKLTMWISTQTPFRHRESFQIELGLPHNKVRIIAPYVGGSHGGKGETLKEYFFAAMLTMKIGRPVKYLQSRNEETTVTSARGSCTYKWKIGAKKDGSLTAIKVDCVRDVGGYGTLAMNLASAVVDYVASVNFICPNISERTWATFTNRVSTGGYRGFGYFEGNVSLAPVIDELIEKLGMDPVEWHLKNVPDAGYRVGYEQSPLTSTGLKECITKCADTIEWKKKWHKPGTKTLPDGRKHGIGLGIVVGCAMLGEWGTSTVEVRIEWDGTVNVLSGCTELGMGQTTGLCQIAAEVLGARFEDVTITFGDSETTPWTIPQAASNSTVNTGMPCKMAAEDARRQMLQIAADMMGKGYDNPIPVLPPLPPIAPGVTVDDLDIKDSRVFIKSDPKKSMTFGELLTHVRTIIGKGRVSIKRKDLWFKQPDACCVELAVDTETGKIEILNSVVAVDCGRAISPRRVQAQFESVLSGGMGFILSEEPVWDQASGRMLNPTWLDYKLPTTMDTGPDMLEPIILVEPIDPYGPFGAKGSGEAGIVPMASALPAAIYNAIGVRMEKSPLTPENILKILGKV